VNVQSNPRNERQVAFLLQSQHRRQPDFNFTDSQRHERAKQEVAMRAGQLRRLPTIFGGL
jgi:hypothetical protein